MLLGWFIVVQPPLSRNAHTVMPSAIITIPCDAFIIAILLQSPAAPIFVIMNFDVHSHLRYTDHAQQKERHRLYWKYTDWIENMTGEFKYGNKKAGTQAIERKWIKKEEAGGMYWEDEFESER